MTVLVLAGNVLLMFVGWEGVGLASYLLIGFYFQQELRRQRRQESLHRQPHRRLRLPHRHVPAARQLRHAHLQLRSSPSSRANPAWQGGVLTAIALCLLLGAAGKTAQLPLYVWLPDAMEGPTPVSALIHAATMVTAGVYMVARTHVLFDRSPFALGVVAIIGAATALFAATIGLVQNDIKRVLAYSTISQLGYMFLGCGVAAYSAAIFHLVTHAFFKALLFLAAGSVIHALGGEQDMRKMGGLRKKLPITFWTMTAAVFAIAGIPPLRRLLLERRDPLRSLPARHLRQGPLVRRPRHRPLTSFYMFRLWYHDLPRRAAQPRRPSPREPLVHARPARHSRCCFPSAAAGSASSASAAFLAPVDRRVCTLQVRQRTQLELILSVVAVLVALDRLVHRRQVLPPQARAPRAARRRPARPPTSCSPTSTTSTRSTAQSSSSRCSPFSTYVLGWIVDTAILGGSAWLLGGIANLCRRDSAALAIRQPALLRGMARCWSRRRAALRSAPDRRYWLSTLHSRGEALR